MKVIIIDEDITMLVADEGKMLTDESVYCYDVRLAHAEDQSLWSEIDEGDVPQDNADEPEGDSK